MHHQNIVNGSQRLDVLLLVVRNDFDLTRVGFEFDELQVTGKVQKVQEQSRVTDVERSVLSREIDIEHHLLESGEARSKMIGQWRCLMVEEKNYDLWGNCW